MKTDTIARLEARLPAELHAMLKHAAELQGRTLSDFVVSAAREAAQRAIEDAHIIKLSVEDQIAFAKALIDPPPPSPALIEAAALWRRNVEVR
ncbi:MAG: DUF1778 domain-containing protein [Beijerinckiaceae bacterium]|nr:DUF1778 domain-containing protein [Beijerinckiaceae bacterium]